MKVCNTYQNMDLSKLQKKITPQWRIQQFSKNKAQASCIAYIDARDVMKILDEVVGPGNWQDDYKMVGDQRFAGVGIKIDGEWIWKWDTGSESNVEKEKGEVSDSFKRAAVKWGIGRFLYDLEIQYVDTNEAKKGDNYPYVITKDKQRVWDLSRYINSNKKEL